MYPSDYGYATDLSLCADTTLYKYNSSTNLYACRTNDWLFKSVYQWTISSNSYSSGGVFRMYESGSITLDLASNYHYQVLPVLYLKSDVMMTGEGTTSDGVSYYVVE